jgi:hypothetical protein
LTSDTVEAINFTKRGLPALMVSIIVTSALVGLLALRTPALSL